MNKKHKVPGTDQYDKVLRKVVDTLEAEVNKVELIVEALYMLSNDDLEKLKRVLEDKPVSGYDSMDNRNVSGSKGFQV
jgi:hypothetical protein